MHDDEANEAGERKIIYDQINTFTLKSKKEEECKHIHTHKLNTHTHRVSSSTQFIQLNNFCYYETPFFSLILSIKQSFVMIINYNKTTNNNIMYTKTKRRRPRS